MPISPVLSRKITWGLTALIGLVLFAYHGLWATFLPDETWFHGLAAKTLAEHGPLAVFTTPNHLAYGTFFWAVLTVLQLIGHGFRLDDFHILLLERAVFAALFCSPLLLIRWVFGHNLRDYALALAFYISTTIPLWYGKIISSDTLLLPLTCLFLWQTVLYHRRGAPKHLWWALALLGLATGVKLYSGLLGLLLVDAPERFQPSAGWRWLRAHFRREWFIGAACFLGALMVGNTALWAGTATTSVLSSSSFDANQHGLYFDGRHFAWAFNHLLVPYNDGAFTVGWFQGLVSPIAFFIILYYGRRWMSSVVLVVMLLLGAFLFCYAREYMTWYWFPFVLAFLVQLPVHRPWLVGVAIVSNLLTFHSIFDFQLMQKDLLSRDQHNVEAAMAEGRQRVRELLPADSVTVISTYSYLWQYQHGDPRNQSKEWVVDGLYYDSLATPYVAHICSDRHFNISKTRQKFFDMPNYILEGRENHELDTTLSILRGNVYIWRRQPKVKPTE